MYDFLKLNIKKLKNKQTLIIVITVFVTVLIANNINNSNSAKTVSIQKNTETSPQLNQSPEKYKELETTLNGSIGASKHYLFTLSTKPTYEDIKSFIIKEKEKGCGENRTVCNFYLWDNEDACNDAIYSSKKLLSGDAIEIATKNKESLAGYINSGNMVFYYGVTGDNTGKSTIIYDEIEKEFVAF